MDLIERNKVIEVAMQYCPDDDGTCSKADKDIRELLDELEAISAADVVSVVRCRDCKHLSNRDEEGGKCWRESGFARAVENNDFCSYGERKEA